jgi:hypothetical protein
MAPAIPRGSRLRVEVLGGRECRPGDVVYVLSEESFLVHRVAHVPGEHRDAIVITRGDACLAPDPPLRTDRVLGTVTSVGGPGGWSPPPGERALSIWHGWARRACLACVVLALGFGPGAARRVALGLQALESWTRRPAGRLLRGLRLLRPGDRTRAPEPG